MKHAMIAPGFVSDALDCLSRAGLDPKPVLEQVNLISSIDQPISNEDYGLLWRAIAAAMDDEFFGLSERPMRLGSFALMCHSLMGTKTLEHATRRALRFMRVVLEDPHGVLEVKDGLAFVVLSDNKPMRPAFAYRTYWLLLMGVLCWLVGRRVPLRSLAFSCPAPEGRPDYGCFFGAHVRFDQETNAMVFDASWLKLPVIRTEEDIGKFLDEAPGNILLRYRQEEGVGAHVRAILSALPPAEWPDFNALASSLNIPSATLRRRLKTDGQSYQAIKDEMRLVAALRLLQSDRTLAAIATELGYSEPSAFYRAFLKQTGQTPRAVRESGREYSLQMSGGLEPERAQSLLN